MSDTKSAIVTGAGTGVGRAAATALLNAGWSVGLAGRRLEPLEETAQLSGAGGRALCLPTDVTKDAEVEAMVAAMVKAHGRLDFIFNNAGMGARPVDMDELSTEEWRAAVEVNLTGAFLCTRAAFAQMRRQDPMGGRIVNNGSISATTPRPFSAPYTATKHAITGLTKSTALDGRRYNIACGQIDIGNAATPMTEKMQTGVPQPDGSTKVEPTMPVAHVGDAVAHMAGLPLDSNILTMTIMATDMPFVGRG
ncbi:MAG: SDR family oxidoreductase [Alphaproteobacteria bacterium]|nr:SDR family oxidoreductase [Alphaproteobacteria bacterium]